MSSVLSPTNSSFAFAHQLLFGRTIEPWHFFIDWLGGPYRAKSENEDAFENLVHRSSVAAELLPSPSTTITLRMRACFRKRSGIDFSFEACATPSSLICGSVAATSGAQRSKLRRARNDKPDRRLIAERFSATDSPAVKALRCSRRV